MVRTASRPGLLVGAPQQVGHRPGEHVAIDMRTDEVVLVADNPQELEAEIRAQGLTHLATMRAPAVDEPARAPVRWISMSRLDRITSGPVVCHGQPTIRGLRYRWPRSSTSSPRA